MKLTDIEPGSEVFIDANIFIYHFTGVSQECTDFLCRCEEGDLSGMTSVNVFLEVLHRLMMVEAVKKRLAKPPDIVRKLQRNPEKIKQLNEYFFNAGRISEMGIEIKPLSFDTVAKSQILRSGYGLMVNDSIVAACMQDEGIGILATNDDGFSKIEWLTVHKPGDLKRL
ncbi:MAG: type II toxin-antitoxin system VapC family toxin [Deltaproteobacteria bacterium]|nr:type II toxin-antitoxin system VapC family toxin [Deltaproteobacteria bacterium]